jgi:hypothetical protein
MTVAEGLDHWAEQAPLLPDGRSRDVLGPREDLDEDEE